jgi:hypothetical protein
MHTAASDGERVYMVKSVRCCMLCDGCWTLCNGCWALCNGCIADRGDGGQEQVQLHLSSERYRLVRIARSRELGCRSRGWCTGLFG